MRTVLHTVTPGNYSFSLEESGHQGQLSLRGYSPVYWADRRALADEIDYRRNAQDDAADDSPATDRDKKTRGPFLQGDHRPFPDWDILDQVPDTAQE